MDIPAFTKPHSRKRTFTDKDIGRFISNRQADHSGMPVQCEDLERYERSTVPSRCGTGEREKIAIDGIRA